MAGKLVDVVAIEGAAIVGVFYYSHKTIRSALFQIRDSRIRVRDIPLIAKPSSVVFHPQQPIIELNALDQPIFSLILIRHRRHFNLWLHQK